MVQELRKQRSELSNNTGHKREKNKYTSIIQCGICGAKFERSNKAKGKKWICSIYNSRGKSECPSKAIPEEVLNEVTLQVLEVNELTDDLVQENIDYIETFNGNKIVYHFKDGKIQEAYWKDKSRRDSWTPEMKEMARQRALKKHRKEVE